MFYKNTIREFGVLTIFSVMFLTGLLYKGYADAKQDEKYVNVRWKEIIVGTFAQLCCITNIQAKCKMFLSTSSSYTCIQKNSTTEQLLYFS